MVEWIISDCPVGYPAALSFMEARVADIAAGRAGECVWLLEHPPLYTAGISARAADLHDPDRLPVFTAGRGGQYTYHGPGQRVAYVMLDLNRRGRDIRAFVSRLEEWVIATLAAFGVTGLTHPDRVGVWVARPDKAPLADGTPREAGFLHPLVHVDEPQGYRDPVPVHLGHRRFVSRLPSPSTCGWS
jgi:lipoyl(octanoyl) transferase